MADWNWRKPEVNESLVALYLRLNGYFTTGLIVHAREWGQSRAEIREKGREKGDILLFPLANGLGLPAARPSGPLAGHPRYISPRSAGA